MKYILLIVLSITTFSLKAQDKLQLIDSSKLDVRIDQIDEDGRLIYYTVNNEKAVISFEAVTKYFYKNKWYIIASKSTFKSKKKWLGDHILSPKDSGLRLCRIHTNLVPLLKDGSDGWFTGFQSKKLISLELEYLVGNWAFDFPIQIGIQNQRDLNTEILYKGSFPKYRHFSSFGTEVEKTTGYEGLPTFRQYYQYNRPKIGHYVQTRFQIGVKPKYYFSEHRKRSLYVAVGLSFGVGDFGASTYYETLSYEDIKSSWGDKYYRYWHHEELKVITVRNTFSYFRQEAQLGLEVNLGSRLSITVEGGFSSYMKNSGPIQDVVYAREGERMYEKVAQYDYRPDSSWHLFTYNLLLANFYIGYRLGKINAK
ncbi:MAG: hypothetical protein ACI8ZN_001511 [Bacteroidia bacterium]|jgi:hypothetical protein